MWVNLPQYGDLFPTAKDRLLYVAGVIAGSSQPS